jgi:hypothetical protein
LGGVRIADPATDQAHHQKLRELFSHADTAATIRYLDESFNNHTFSLKSLFRDEQRKITNQILEESTRSAAAAYRSIYETQAPLLRFLHGLGVPVPASLHAAVEIALNNQLRETLEQDDPDRDRVLAYFREAADNQVQIDSTTLEFALRKKLETAAEQFVAQPDVPDVVHRFTKLLTLSLAMPFPVVLWEVQNMVFAPLLQAIENYGTANGNDNAAKKACIAELLSLRDALKIEGTHVKSHAAAS